MRHFLKVTALAFALTVIAPPAAHLVAGFSVSEAYAYREGDPRLNKWLGVNTRRVRWCGLFLAKIITAPPRFAASVDSWRRWGRRVKCRPGTVAIFRHRHVGLVTAVDGNRIKVKSGNDGNAIKDRWRNRSSIKECRAK